MGAPSATAAAARTAPRLAGAGRGLALGVTSTGVESAAPRLAGAGRGARAWPLRTGITPTSGAKATRAAPPSIRGGGVTRSSEPKPARATATATATVRATAPSLRGAGRGMPPEGVYKARHPMLVRGHGDAHGGGGRGPRPRAHAHSHARGSERSGGGADGEGVAWLADDVRELALEALRNSAVEASSAAARRAAAVQQASPTRLLDYAKMLAQVPPTHWAAPYLREVARSLDANADAQPAQKLAVITETLDALRTPDDPRFADA